MASIHDAIKQQRTADALRYAGARLSTVGRRVVVSGRRVALGRAIDRPVETAARDYLAHERRPAVQVGGIPTCPRPHLGACDVRCGRMVRRWP